MVLICGFEKRFPTANICGFAVKSCNLPQVRKATTSLVLFLCNFKKITFLRFSVLTDLSRCIYKVQNPLTKFRCCGAITFLGYTAILTAKRACLTSRNFQRLVFLKGNLDFLKWQGVVQDDFGDMPSTSSQQVGCRPTNIFNLIVLSF